jgi:hypothetical protein
MLQAWISVFAAERCTVTASIGGPSAALAPGLGKAILFLAMVAKGVALRTMTDELPRSKVGDRFGVRTINRIVDAVNELRTKDEDARPWYRVLLGLGAAAADSPRKFSRRSFVMPCRRR